MPEVVYYAVSRARDSAHVKALIRQQYEKQGYTRDAHEFEQLTAYLGLPSTTTFVARKNTSLIGTISLIGDSNHSMPMAAAFSQEIAALREGQRRLAEVSQLAIDGAAATQHERFDILQALFSLVFHHARATHIDYLCIAINPKHEKLYDALSFTTFGVRDAYRAVSGAPAIAKSLDVQVAAQQSSNNPLIQRIVRDERYLQLDWGRARAERS